MGRFHALPTAAVLETVLGPVNNVENNAVPGEHAEVHETLVSAWDEAWQATDPYVLELCRVRIAMLLGSADEADPAARTPAAVAARTPAAVAAALHEPTVAALASWTTDPRFRPVDRACLAFTEQYVVDVANLDDATVGHVRDHLGETGLQDFLCALFVVEQRVRLRLAWDALFPEGMP